MSGFTELATQEVETHVRQRRGEKKKKRKEPEKIMILRNRLL